MPCEDRQQTLTAASARGLLKDEPKPSHDLEVTRSLFEWGVEKKGGSCTVGGGVQDVVRGMMVRVFCTEAWMTPKGSCWFSSSFLISVYW